METEIITNRQIYDEVIQSRIPSAEKFVWIATADIKDLYVKKLEKFIPFLQIISNLIDDGVEVRLLHAKEPGPNFRKDFDRFPNLIKKLERMLCPRVHFKSVIVDGGWIYTGSANLTGAGMGAKADTTRNFECGITSDDPKFIQPVMQQFDDLWIGNNCTGCKRKSYCTDCVE